MPRQSRRVYNHLPSAAFKQLQHRGFHTIIRGQLPTITVYTCLLCSHSKRPVEALHQYP